MTLFIFYVLKVYVARYFVKILEQKINVMELRVNEDVKDTKQTCMMRCFEALSPGAWSKLMNNFCTIMLSFQFYSEVMMEM